ncbi:MAG: DsbA family protein [Gemmatimonadota bacterium]
MNGHTLTPPVGLGDHVQGSADAPLTLVEYGDYECPYCGRAQPIVRAVQRRLGEDLRFAFRHFPLTQVHPHAQPAAEAAEAAAEHGRFWLMHDRLFQSQRALDHAGLIADADALGIEPAWIAAALLTHAFADRVRRHFLTGLRSGVNGTPTFFVNGVRHDGPWDESSLLVALEAALYAPRMPASTAKRT